MSQSSNSALGRELNSLIERGANFESVYKFFERPDLPGNPDLLVDIQQRTPLMVSVLTQTTLPITRFLLSQGSSVHVSVPDLGFTALHIASHSGNEKGTALLLAAGADPLRLDAMGRSALHWAAISGEASVLNRLLRAMLDRVTTVALAWDEQGGAGQSSTLSTSNSLIETVISVSRLRAMRGDSLQAVLEALQGEAAHKALMVPGRGSAFTAKGVLQKPASPKEREQAMVLLRVTIMETLLAFFNAQDDSGYTALMLAAEHGRQECVKSLLEAGVDSLKRTKLGHSASGVRFFCASSFFSISLPRSPSTQPRRFLPHLPPIPQLAEWFGHKSCVAQIDPYYATQLTATKGVDGASEK